MPEANEVHPGRWSDQLLASLRPHRADAARNFDAVLEAARRLFNERGAEVAMPEIAAAAGVGVATLYRSFPSREALIEAAYVAEVEDLRAAADELRELDPDRALDRWLVRFLGYLMTKRVLARGLNERSDAYQSCRRVIYATGGELLARAQTDGTARRDCDIDTVMRFVMAVSLGVYTGDAQRRQVLGLAIAGLHAGG